MPDLNHPFLSFIKWEKKPNNIVYLSNYVYNDMLHNHEGGNPVICSSMDRTGEY